MASRERPQKLKRRKFFSESWRFPHLDEFSHPRSNQVAIGTKLEGSHRGLEREMMQHKLSVQVYKYASAIFVDGEKQRTIGGDFNPADILGILAAKTDSF